MGTVRKPMARGAVVSEYRGVAVTAVVVALLMVACGDVSGPGEAERVSGGATLVSAETLSNKGVGKGKLKEGDKQKDEGGEEDGPTEPPAACSDYPHIRVVEVGTARQLSDALAVAVAGDLILLNDGRYGGPFSVGRSGTAAAPITLCGTVRAVLDGGSITGRTVLRHSADHWNLVGFTVTEGSRGVLLDGASRNVLRDLTVHTMGQEAVHFRNFSSHNVIAGSRIYETGLVEARYGEGVYIGTSSKQWVDGVPDASDYNQVLDNVFGPNIRAENVDVKDGTTGGVIRGNTFSGVGTSEDDWVDLGGNRYVIERNTGSVLAAGHGFRVRVSVAGWGNHNVFAENVVDLQGPGYGFRVDTSTSGNVVRCNNVVTNAGSGLSNITCTP
jgi:hypothetical protein